MLYNSGPWTLVHIVEVSVIGAVRFRRFHCILIPSRNLLIIANWFLCYFFLQLHSLVDPVSAMGEWCAWSRLTHVTGRFSINSVCVYMQEKMLSCLKTRSLVPPYPNPCIKCMVRTSQLTVWYSDTLEHLYPHSHATSHVAWEWGYSSWLFWWFTCCYSDVLDQYINLLVAQLWRPDSPPWFKVQSLLNSQRFLNTSRRLSCWCNPTSTPLQNNHLLQALSQLESNHHATLLPHPQVWPRECIWFLRLLNLRLPLKNNQPFNHLLNQLVAGHCLKQLQLQRGHHMIYIHTKLECLHQLLHPLHIQSTTKRHNRVHHILKKALITRTYLQQLPLPLLFLQGLL